MCMDYTFHLCDMRSSDLSRPSHWNASDTMDGLCHSKLESEATSALRMFVHLSPQRWLKKQRFARHISKFRLGFGSRASEHTPGWKLALKWKDQSSEIWEELNSPCDWKLSGSVRMRTKVLRTRFIDLRARKQVWVDFISCYLASFHVYLQSCSHDSHSHETIWINHFQGKLNAWNHKHVIPSWRK